MEFEVKAGVAYPGAIQTGSSPNLDLEEEGRTRGRLRATEELDKQS